MKRLGEWISARLRPRPAGLPAIRVVADGFVSGDLRVEWADVRLLAAYKIDRVTFDDVLFAFQLADGRQVTIHEEQPGFAAFERMLTERFPSAAGWRERVILPAFERNWSVLYRHDDAGTVTPGRGQAQESVP